NQHFGSHPSAHPDHGDRHEKRRHKELWPPRNLGLPPNRSTALRARGAHRCVSASRGFEARAPPIRLSAASTSAIVASSVEVPAVSPTTSMPANQEGSRSSAP